jgi:hypothetical protein
MTVGGSVAYLTMTIDTNTYYAGVDGNGLLYVTVSSCQISSSCLTEFHSRHRHLLLHSSCLILARRTPRLSNTRRLWMGRRRTNTFNSRPTQSTGEHRFLPADL